MGWAAASTALAALNNRPQSVDSLDNDLRLLSLHFRVAFVRRQSHLCRLLWTKAAVQDFHGHGINQLTLNQPL